MSNIHKKILEIGKDVGFIVKDASNSFQHYNYASELAIKKAFKPVLAKHRVIMTCDDARLIAQNDKIVIMGYTFSFIDSETGDSHTCAVTSSSLNTDKAGMICMTGAIKYVLTTTFLIPTGEEAENPKYGPEGQKEEDAKVVMDEQEPEPERVSEPKKADYDLVVTRSTLVRECQAKDVPFPRTNAGKDAVLRELYDTKMLIESETISEKQNRLEMCLPETLLAAIEAAKTKMGVKK